MKTEELAEQLLKYPGFDVHFSIIEPDGSPYGIGCRTFEVGIDDIGYSSKIVSLGPQSEIE